MDLYSRYVEQLVRMGSAPGAQHYAKARAKELEADPSGLFQGIYAEVKERVASGQVELPACVRPVLVKSR